MIPEVITLNSTTAMDAACHLKNREICVLRIILSSNHLFESTDTGDELFASMYDVECRTKGNKRRQDALPGSR